MRDFQGINFLWKPTYREIFFCYQGYLHSHWRFTGQQGKEGGPSFIPLYHFHPLTNIETFICNFACEMTITYFYSQRLCLPDCYSIRFTTLLNYHFSDWLMMQYLFVYLMNWYYVFVTAIWNWKSVDLNSHRLLPLYYKRTA